VAVIASPHPINFRPNPSAARFDATLHAPVTTRL
jgi:hypothetical protein